jgi:hypothetical protein
MVCPHLYNKQGRNRRSRITPYEMPESSVVGAMPDGSCLTDLRATTQLKADIVAVLGFADQIKRVWACPANDLDCHLLHQTI